MGFDIPLSMQLSLSSGENQHHLEAKQVLDRSPTNSETFSAGAYVSLGISFSFPLSELPEMVQPLNLNPPVAQLLYVLCYTFGSLPITNTLNDVVHVGVVSNDFGLLKVLLLRHFARFSQCYCCDGSPQSFIK